MNNILNRTTVVKETCPAGQNIPINALVTVLVWGKLIGSEAVLQEGMYVWCSKARQTPMTKEIIAVKERILLIVS